MLRTAYAHVRRHFVAATVALTVAMTTIGLITTLGMTRAGADEPSQDVRAAGADIQAAPRVAELVRQDAIREAAERRAARARAEREGDVQSGLRAEKADRYAVVPAPQPPAPNYAAGGTVWDRLARCESSGNWASSVGLYEGGLQFHPSTWDRSKPAGYPDAAYQASREQQIAVAERVLARQGWGAWPACASELGLR